VGIYVGSLVLGASLSLFVTGALTTVAGWRMAFMLCSVGVLLGTVLSLLVFRGYRQTMHARTAEENYVTAVVKNRPAMLMIFGYGAHMWEMYGMRSWLAPFFTASLLRYGLDKGVATGWGATASALIIGIGTLATAVTGTLSDRIGRTRTIAITMTASALLSFGFGWLINGSPYLALAVGFVYGYLIVAESPVFSTGLTELVSPSFLGSAMGMQSLIGYSLAMISPTVFGWALDLCRGWQPLPGIDGAWGVGFATCGMGALAGPLCMYLLRREPSGKMMAGGKM
jgi:MFS family permease